MKQRTFYTEIAYAVGLIFLAFSAALMEAADFGVSMVVAPAYLLHLKLSETFAFFSYGVAEYTLQALLLIVMILILRRFKLYYLFSFVTAVLYGLLLDGSMVLVSYFPMESFALRLVWYVIGVLVCAASIALLFHTYIAPEVYELIVKELSSRYGWKISIVKTVFDCASCAVAIVMSFSFFGLFRFEGVKAGTIICALFNGWLIGCFSKLFEKFFRFTDRLPLRRYFE